MPYFSSIFDKIRSVHKIVLASAISLSAFFFYTKDLSDCYDKVIMAEGHGYYAYLLSTYIYHDPTFEFFNSLYPQYYCASVDPPTRNFINEFEGIRVNKYYPGVSLLWLPFFLIAHLIAHLAGLTADGYSDIYQYAIGIAGIIYTVIGIHFTRRVLERFRVSVPVQALVLFTLLFGTNLLIYSGAWPSQTHAYSFAILSALVFHLFRLFDEDTADRARAFSIVLVLSALAITIRPQSIAIFFLFPFFGCTTGKAVNLIKKELFTWTALIGILIAGAILFRVLYLWHLQTGRWLLNPYHGESYDLTQPHVIDILFSFRKGWLLYSPFAGIALLGALFFPERKQRVNLILFWMILVYVSSCWWCWTYSQTSFGQRTFVDFYVLIGLQAGVLMERLRKRLWSLLLSLSILLIALNLLQTHQYRHGILDGDRCDRASYLRDFFETRSIARYPIPVASIIRSESVVEDFDGKDPDRRVVPNPVDGGLCTILSDSIPYSDGITTGLPGFLDGSECSHVRIRLDVIAPKGVGENAFLVMDMQRAGTTFGYAIHPIRTYVHGPDRTTLEFGMQVPEPIQSGDRIKVYGWRKEGPPLDTVFIDDLRLEFIRTDSSHVLLKR